MGLDEKINVAILKQKTLRWYTLKNGVKLPDNLGRQVKKRSKILHTLDELGETHNIIVCPNYSLALSGRNALPQVREISKLKKALYITGLMPITFGENYFLGNLLIQDGEIKSVIPQFKSSIQQELELLNFYESEDFKRNKISKNVKWSQGDTEYQSIPIHIYNAFKKNDSFKITKDPKDKTINFISGLPKGQLKQILYSSNHLSNAIVFGEYSSCCKKDQFENVSSAHLILPNSIESISPKFDENFDSYSISRLKIT